MSAVEFPKDNMMQKEWREEREGVWDLHEYSAIFKIDSQQGPTVQHRELFSALCGRLDGRGV